MRTRRSSITIIIGLIAIIIFVVAILLLSGPMIGNIFSDVINGLGDTPPANIGSTEAMSSPSAQTAQAIATLSDVQMTATALASLPDNTSMPATTATHADTGGDNTPTSAETEDNVDATFESEDTTATEFASNASITDTPIPTLSTEQFRTAVANLATAQTSPTPAPVLTSTVGESTNHES